MKVGWRRNYFAFRSIVAGIVDGYEGGLEKMRRPRSIGLRELIE
jgi:hypothetical protein